MSVVNFRTDDRRRATDTLVDKDDFRELRDEMREGFRGVHLRQDTTNGRLIVVEKVQAGHIENIKALQHDMNRRKSVRRESDTPAPEDAKPITRREVGLVFGTIGGVWAVVKGFAWVMPFLKFIKAVD